MRLLKTLIAISALALSLPAAYSQGAATRARPDLTTSEDIPAQPAKTQADASSAAGGAEAEAKSKSEAQPQLQLPPCLAEIFKAQAIEDGSLKSAKLRGSLLEAQKMGAGAKDALTEMAQTASPAGRLISVALLKRLDAPLSTKLAQALKQELGDQSVSYVSPAERCHYSVSDILNDMASAHPLIKVLPEASAK